jgi:hypothetical protein
MGGYGSGRSGFWRRRRTSSARQLDIITLPNALLAQMPFRVVWTGGLGGVPRPWWECPACGGRVRILYNRGGWRCRRCEGLAYPCQLQDAGQRALNRARKIRARLGASGSHYIAEVPPRPPRMHRTTYERLVRELLEAERRSLQHATRRLW